MGKLKNMPGGAHKPTPLALEICILAGGLSRRMGRDKAQLPIGGGTLLSTIRASAKATGLPVRVIRRDHVPRCGPLGGIYTALKTTRADVILFLPCDTPFVSTELLQFLLDKMSSGRLSRPPSDGVFVAQKDTVGFPFLLRRAALAGISEQIKRRDFSLQALARLLRAKKVHLSSRWSGQLRNLNTPEDWARACKSSSA